MRARRTLFGLLSLFGIARRGFFIPLRGANRLPLPGGQPPYAALEASFIAHAEGFEQHLAVIEEHAAALEALGKEPAPAPHGLHAPADE